MRTIIALSCAALMAVLAGCATPQATRTAEASPCPKGQSRANTVELVFGRNDGDRLAVTDADWRRFIDEVVTPRFPDGLSVMDVQGQWRAPGGILVREPSKIVYLVLDGGPDDPAKIANIRESYKQRFNQKSVLLVSQKACVSF
jgi:hypothetical protein